MDEFSLIQKYFTAAGSNTGKNGVVQGIGDDTAILKVAEHEELLVTTDTLISGVHFPTETDPVAIGYKALAVNLSDIAAMGGEARWFTLALSLSDSEPEWLQGFSRGLLKLAEEFDVSLVGGDTTRGDLSITITAMGTIPDTISVRRSGAVAGDLIYITGSPGFAALGLASLNGDIDLADNEQNQYLDKLNYPQPRLHEGQFLRDYVSSMIDVSDGVTADLGHILHASSCAAVIDLESLVSSLQASSSVTENRLLKAVLHGGDDYELLFTLSPEKARLLEQNWLDSYSPVTRIGEINAGEGITLRQENGELINIAASGYNHFND